MCVADDIPNSLNNAKCPKCWTFSNNAEHTVQLLIRDSAVVVLAIYNSKSKKSSCLTSAKEDNEPFLPYLYGPLLKSLC